MKQLVSNLLIAVVSSVLTFFLLNHYHHHPSPVEVVAGEAPPARFARLSGTPLPDAAVNAGPRGWATAPADFVAVTRTVTDAVVNITAYSNDGRSISNGSGVIYSRDGYIITNHHVVEDGYRYEVTLSDKRRLPARLLGSDPTTDLALIKINEYGLHPIRLGNSDEVEVGEWVLAIGNPFNLTSTVTAGIVSAKGRNLNIIDDSYSIESFIQTDAVVNPGNSGGALVNTQGALVGINTAILSESGRYEGYSFAIPVNLAAKVVDDLREYGFVQRAILGVAIRDLTDRLALDLRLPSIEGVLVSEIHAGGSADRSGLVPGDVIVSIDNVRTSTVPELQELIARYRPGARISLEFYRDGRKLRLNNVILQGLTHGGYSNR
jgi:S1-C subfamily serine protease